MRDGSVTEQRPAEPRNAARRQERTGRRRFALRLAAGTAVLFVPLSLAACEDNQFQETVANTDGAEGVNSFGTPVVIRNARVATPSDTAYPKGGEAPLLFSLANMSGQRDRLEAVTSPEASAVVLRSAGGQSSPVDIEIPAAAVEPVTLYMTGLAQELVAGSSVTVTFEFQSNPPIELSVPVATPNGREDREAEEIHASE